MISSDYSGRLVDLELLQTVSKPVALQRVYISNVRDTPKAVTGIEKAVQRYTLLLLQTLGSVAYAPTLGGRLMELLSRGYISNLGYLRHIFGIANFNALSAMARDNSDSGFGTLPDDENIVGATLAGAAIDRSTGTVTLEITITTAAGSAYDYVVPLATMG